MHSPRAGRKTGLDYSPVLKYIVVVYPTMEETYKVITTSWQSPLQKKKLVAFYLSDLDFHANLLQQGERLAITGFCCLSRHLSTCCGARE